ncbi:NB-ARC - like 10 [Theobroma cacao]|nr:NB-ARC - like 10 [Theobroma cacao]
MSKLPASLGSLRCLQTLDLRVQRGVHLNGDIGGPIHVPNVIWRMKQLRHLYLPQYCDRKTKLKLCTLRNLLTLVNFNTRNCYVADLHNMMNLRDLQIFGSFHIEDFEDLGKNPAILGNNNILRSLTLTIESIEIPDPRHVTHLIFGCANIYELRLVLKIGKLPEYHHFSSNIASMYLRICNLVEDPMPTLGRLPNLRILKVREDAFTGKEMACSAQSFVKLDFLSIYRLHNLEEWKVDEGAMPALRHLEIFECKNLKMLPNGLRIGELLTQEATSLWGVEEQVGRFQTELKWMQSLLLDADARRGEGERVRLWVAEIRDLAYDAEDELRDGEGSSSSYEKQELRRSFPHVIEDNIVGFSDKVEELVSDIIDEAEKRYQVVSICGMGGMGKTTLAKMVYHHSQVRGHCNHLAWVYVSQQCRRRTVWEDMLCSLKIMDNEQSRWKREEDLAEMLFTFWKDKRCLVVLDDLWSIQAWDSIKPAFPMRETSSKFLLTSRNKEVASHADRRSYLHELECLNEDNSWKLFQKNIIFYVSLTPPSSLPLFIH